jgi:hypothetical protein
MFWKTNAFFYWGRFENTLVFHIDSGYQCTFFLSIGALCFKRAPMSTFKFEASVCMLELGVLMHMIEFVNLEASMCMLELGALVHMIDFLAPMLKPPQKPPPSHLCYKMYKG